MCVKQCRCTTDCKDTIFATCRNPMCYEVKFVGENNSTADTTSEGGYVKGLVTYMVTDDLSVSPMSMISGVAQINKFNVRDFGALEERMAEFGINGLDKFVRNRKSRKFAKFFWRITEGGAAMTNSKISLKLLIDTNRNQVVFAEAGKDFVDFLLHLLSLPVGRVVRLIKKSAMTGCIANLYESLESLNESYLQPNQNKDSLLCPVIVTKVTNSNFMLPYSNKKPENQKLHYCSKHPGCVSDVFNSFCSHCTSPGYPRYRNQEVKFNGTSDSTTSSAKPNGEGGYVKALVTYMVTNDLSVSPMSMVSGVGLLNKFNIKDFGVLEEKVVDFGIDEGIELLKASLLSKDALTAVFLKQKVTDVASST
ncbi:hypothetical protein Peur_043284 [Populus x canadensis]